MPPDPAPASSPDVETLPGTMHLFGFPEFPVEVRIVRHDARARTRRALRALGLCWGLAVVSILVPIAHFVLVPGFFVLGIVLAVRWMGEAASVLGASGACPRCGAAREFVASGPLRAQGKAQCPVCRNELALTIDPARVRG